MGIICDTCTKRENKTNCHVLVQQITSTKGNAYIPNRRYRKLPIWGPKCTAYSDDPNWEEKVNQAVAKYRKYIKRKFGGGIEW